MHRALRVTLALAALVTAPALAPAAGAVTSWRLYGLPREVEPFSLYDAGNRRILMVGAYENAEMGYVVWSADLDTTQGWAPLQTTGSPPIDSYGQQIPLEGGTVDPVRHRLVVWGATLQANGTWALSLDTGVWSRLCDGPAAPNEVGEAVVYDPVGDRILMFGGLDYGLLGFPSGSNGVSQLNLTGTPAWSVLTVAGTRPTGRGYCAAAFDPPHNRVLIFGGEYVGSSPSQSYVLVPMDETWELSLNGTPTWRFLPPTIPLPAMRQGAFAARDSLTDRLVIIGGKNASGSVVTDMWGMSLSDPDSARWTELATGVSLAEASIFDPVRRSFATAGGDQDLFTNPVSDAQRAGGRFEIRLDGVPQLKTRFPTSFMPGYGGPVGQGKGGQLVMMSPASSGPGYFIWRTPVAQPPAWTAQGFTGPGAGSAMVVDTARSREVMFGSTGLWQFTDAGAGGPLVAAGTPPTPRSYCNAVYDAAGDRMLIYGGKTVDASNHVTEYGDLWALTLGGTPTWSRLDLTGPRPPARWSSTAILDAADDRLLVYGGNDTLPLPPTDLWSFSLDSLTWRQWLPGGTLPYPYSPPDLAVYDRQRDRLLLVQPEQSPATGVAVSALPLSGPTIWSQLTMPGNGPTNRDAFGDGGIETFNGYYDDARDRLVLSLEGVRGDFRDVRAPLIWTLYQVDWTTPAEASLVEASVRGGDAHLVWWTGGNTAAAFSVERRAGGGGWAVVGSASRDGNGLIVFDDRGLAPGTYDYRLGIGAGTSVTYVGEVALTVGAPGLVFAPATNPAVGSLRFRVQLPGENAGPAALELYDVTGRRVATRVVTPGGAGPVQVELAGLRPGVYQARLVASGKVLAHARVAVVR